MNGVPIRRAALLSEREALEDLQLPAALCNAGDRDAKLATPDAIEMPLGHITLDRVFVAE